MDPFIPAFLIVKAIRLDQGFQGLMVFPRHPGIVGDRLKSAYVRCPADALLVEIYELRNWNLGQIEFLWTCHIV